MNFAINLCEYSILRFENSHINKIICDAIYDPNLDETKIKLDLLAPIITKKEYKILIDNEGKLNYKKLKTLCEKYKINYYKINKVRKDILIKNLSNKKLIEMIKQERKLNLIMDNAQIHKAQVTKIVAEILNINIIYLPVYSPFLNPIEKVWADIKQELYKEYYESVEDIIQILDTEFYKIVDNKSYTENWVNKFFDINLW